MYRLEETCELLGAEDFQALARMFPGQQEITVPKLKQGKTWDRLVEALGECRANQICETWENRWILIPNAYIWAVECSGAAIYDELFGEGSLLVEIAQRHNTHPWAIAKIIYDEVRRRRKLAVNEALDNPTQSQISISRELGIPPTYMRVLAHKRRTEQHVQGLLFNG